MISLTTNDIAHDAGTDMMLDADIADTVRRHELIGTTGVRLVYLEYLPSGPICAEVLLVHGLASAGMQFEREARRFAEQGFRVLVPDLRGHGASGVPDGKIAVADFAIPVMARDMLDVLDHARAGAVRWVGNSLGGILALHLLGTPNVSRLQSLALFGTCISMRLPGQVSQVLRLSFLPGVRVTAYLTALTTTRDPAGRRAIAEAVRLFNVQAGAAIAANVRTYDFVENLQGFARPVLLLRGGRDHAVNLGLDRDIHRFANQPNFRRIDLPQGGHCANFDMHEEFCTALERHWDAAA